MPLESAREEKSAEPEQLVTRQHRRNGIDYVSTTGRITLEEESVADGVNHGLTARADVFVTAYTVPTETNRPVVFAFNGGPGSGSLWLHLGLLGPRLVDSGDVDNLTAAPYRLSDNPETILRQADLVLIDPVNTAYSRVKVGEKDAEYNGFVRDRDSIAEVIRLWTTRNNRWLSPKYIVGESYGTLRAVAVAHRLFTAYGMTVSGLGLISTVLNMSTLTFNAGNDLPYALHIPTYAAIAHYHGLFRNQSLAEVLERAEKFAQQDLVPALWQGHRLGRRDKDRIVRSMSEVTALPTDFIERTNLRFSYGEFSAELLRSAGLSVGRIDGRFTKHLKDANVSENWDDPSMSAITGPYMAATNHYLRSELGYESDMPYESLSGRVQPWSYSTFEGRPIDVTDELAELIIGNPDLRVHVDYGCYDGATPYFAAEYVWAHLNIPQTARERFSHHYHEAGHMMYLNPRSRVTQLRALAEFVAPVQNSAHALDSHNKHRTE